MHFLSRHTSGRTFLHIRTPGLTIYGLRFGSMKYRDRRVVESRSANCQLFLSGERYLVRTEEKSDDEARRHKKEKPQDTPNRSAAYVKDSHYSWPADKNRDKTFHLIRLLPTCSASRSDPDTSAENRLLCHGHNVRENLRLNHKAPPDHSDGAFYFERAEGRRDQEAFSSSASTVISASALIAVPSLVYGSSSMPAVEV